MQRQPPMKGSPARTGEPFVGYIRVSTYYEDKISPDIQRAALRTWEKRTGNRIVDWIEDLDTTGRNFKRKIMGGIKAVEDGTARGIAVWRYSRFGRSRNGNALNLARLEAVGGRLESATEAADTRTAFGKLQMGMAFKFAEFESDRIGEQWAETRENRLGRGLPTTGGQRWGYVWARRRLDEDGILHPESYDPDPELGLVANGLYERLADGEPMTSACLWLGRNGYLGTRGKPWKQTGLTRYLDSGFCAGWIRHHPDDCECPPADPDGTASRAGLCSNKIWLPGAHESIVKEDVWEAYREQRKKAAATPARVQTPAYALTGHVRCGRCGGSAPVGGGATYGAGKVLIRKNGYVFRCSERQSSGTCDGVYVLRTVVEAAVLERLAEVIEEIEAVKVPAQQSVGAAPSSGRDRVARSRKLFADRLAEIAAELDRQTSLVSRGIVPEESYVRERDRLAAEQLGVTRQIAEIDDQVEPEPTDRVALLPVMRGLLERWEVTPVATRRRLLGTVMKGVWAYPKVAATDDAEEVAAYAVPVMAWEEAPEPMGRHAPATADFCRSRNESRCSLT